MKTAGTRMGQQLLMLYSSTSSRREYIDALARLIMGWIGCAHIKIALMDSEENVYCESTMGDSMDFPLCEKWSTNIMHRGNVLGAIQLADKTLGKISLKRLQFIETIAPLIGEALQRFNLEDELAFQASLLNQVRNAVIASNIEGKIIYWNKFAESIFQWKAPEVMGKHVFDLIVPVEHHATVRAFVQKTREMDYWEGEYVFQRKDESNFYSSILLTVLKDGDGSPQGYVGVCIDISERKKMESQLQYLATHDALTGIPNRYLLEENLKRVTAKARRGSTSALLFIDLDNFKIVNDTLGHTAGDELLTAFARVLSDNLREGDLLFRFGGDEFAVLMEGSGDEDARFVAERLRRVVDEGELYLALQQACFNLTVSIGVVMVDGTVDPQKILAYADTALYTAKEDGRNRVVFLRADEDISVKLSETNKTIGLIKSALKEDRFALYFQPVVKFPSGIVTHYETLLRLYDENGDMVLPSNFIPVAERYGLMPQVDRWVVERALKTLQEIKGISLFINLSGVSLGDETLLDLIEDTISWSNLDPKRIGFEITESVAVKDMSRAERWIRRIKSLGCSFALDDFGIGFSSFSYLRLLPVDYIKIDGSFIRNIDTDPTHKTLVQAIHSVAKTLGKQTIAEFVENEKILTILLDMGINYGQGYFLGKPSSLPPLMCSP